MTTFPLVTHASPESIVAWSHGRPVTVRAFLAEVGRLAGMLPPGGHVFNACTDRYRFTVGLCAALLAGKTSLLPSTHTPEMVRQLLAFAPDAFCLHDFPDCDFAMPRFSFDGEAGGPAGPCPVPQIPADRIMACVFTSGSAGRPVAHRKTWGAMVRGARATAARLGMLDGKAWTLVGTVPPQHMFGFEATVMLALQAGAALTAAPSFYPADIRAALEAAPRPRALVTSPVHLRTLLQAGMDLPPADLILSATAPLGRKLAGEAQTMLAAPLVEIYGSTETGLLATRRTAQTDTWELAPAVRLQPRRNAHAESADDPDSIDMWAEGGHIEQPVALGDAIELLDATHFLLHGRKADLINIAGKRTSLAYLNHQLNAIPGVADGVFFMPPDTHEGDAEGHVVRLVALAVAPGVPVARIQQALRERIDAAFLPRPLLLVDNLPRNAAGKLPRERLEALVGSLIAARHGGVHEPIRKEKEEQVLQSFVIPHDHPALPGHFPGHPVVPGVVLLDHAVLQIGAALQRPLTVSQVALVKFLNPVRPGERVEVRHSIEPGAGGDDTVRFALSAAGRDVASGTLSVRTAAQAAEGAPC
ncbi:AMP-binding protein [Cupriavidus sp. IDO]|uniref:AMP-binding protein n=1 Tax=Cupriavidus sp. IDO TaxID=1539142 RepID=UPI00057943A2|nr:AMP-binding protein [Cupriavidus sp. IDO]KWR77177.1 beta-hydroxyacyl-ACP dehydratase [Cupriavidus sp. IDO]